MASTVGYTDDCFSKNIGLPGNNIAGYDGRKSLKDSAEDCQKLCQEVDECNYFTWRKNTRYCWIKDKKTNKAKEIYGTVSGPKFCNYEGTLQSDVKTQSQNNK